MLDRFVRERAAAYPPRRRWRRFAIPAIAVAALIAAILVAALPSGPAPAYAHAELSSMPAGGGAEGTADAAEVDAGTRVKLRADHLPVQRASPRAPTARPRPSCPRRAAPASTTGW